MCVLIKQYMSVDELKSATVLGFFFPILFFVQVFKRKVSGKLNWKKIVPEPFPTHDLLGDEFSLTRVFLSCKRVSVKYTGIFSANF